MKASSARDVLEADGGLDRDRHAGPRGAHGDAEGLGAVAAHQELTGLLARAEDANDHNLPNMYWYAAESSVGSDNGRALKLLTQSKIPRVREFIARRIAVGSKAVAAK